MISRLIKWVKSLSIYIDTNFQINIERKDIEPQCNITGVVPIPTHENITTLDDMDYNILCEKIENHNGSEYYVTPHEYSLLVTNLSYINSNFLYGNVLLFHKENGVIKIIVKA